VSGGFATTSYGETNDENQSTERCRYPFRCRRCPSVLPGRGHSGRPQRLGTAALAASHPGLHSRSRFRAVPGTAHALEPGKGQIEGGRPGAIAQAVWKLGPKGRRLWRLARHPKGAPPHLKTVGIIEQRPATLIRGGLVIGLRVGTHTLRFGGQQFLVAARLCLAESREG
jgi:hypothetical protein